MSVQVTHKGETVTIKREQDPDSTIAAPYNKTSRPCPPFCVQPMDLAPGVETIGEMELLAYLERMHEGDDDVLVIDSRTPDWVAEGTILGAINIPWTQLDRSRASDQAIESILQLDFGVMRSGKFLDFNQAKTPGAVLQRLLVRAVTGQHPQPAVAGLPGAQAQVVPGRDAGLASAGPDHGRGSAGTVGRQTGAAAG